MIKCRNISLSFNELQVFQKLNLKIEQGEFVCISGESGKGKSTLLKLLQGFELPDNGNIYVSDLELNEKTVHHIRSQMTWVPQNINLSVKNGMELMQLLRIEDQRDKVYELQEQLGLNANSLEKNFSELSGGQKQRLVIAICLCIDTNIILLDEPTSSLDENSINLLIGVVKSQKKKTIVSTSHNKTWLQGADRVIEL